MIRHIPGMYINTNFNIKINFKVIIKIKINDKIKFLKWYKIALLTYKMLAVCPKYAKLIIMYTAKE